MKTLRSGVLAGIACAALAACNGAATSSPFITSPGAGATPSPTPIPTASPVGTNPPSSVSSTTTLANGMALSNAPLTMAVPAPTGFSQSITAPLVNAPANTKVATTSGTSVPPSLVPLSVVRSALGFRRTAAAPPGTYNTIFYDSIVPTANITVAGNLSFNQAYPAGTLIAGTSYYLAFYDTTQASPAWQTIAGPVSPSGASLTFSGTTGSVTLLANKLYGFATFSSVVPTSTPPPAPQTLLYFGDDTGLSIAAESGTIQNSLAIPSQSFDLDDAGNVYAFDFNHGGSSPGQGGAPQLARFPAGSATAAATYQPSRPNRLFVAASGAGEVAAVHLLNGNGILTTDVWDTGATGAPSRTLLTKQNTNFAFAMTHDGTLYLPDVSSAGVPQFDIFPPGAAAPSSVIPETIVAASQYNNFSPNYAAIGLDGTLYVTEYTFQQPDPNAGLYIYPRNGPERFIATARDANGAGPQGVDVDASGNIYVVNDNTAVLTSTTCQGDSLHSVTVYSQAGALLRTVNSAVSGFPVTVAADGTAFVSTFATQLQSSCAATGADGIFSIPAGGTTATEIEPVGSTEIVLFDGTHKTNPLGRLLRSGRGTAATSGGRGGFRRWRSQ